MTFTKILKPNTLLEAIEEICNPHHKSGESIESWKKGFDRRLVKESQLTIHYPLLYMKERKTYVGPLPAAAFFFGGTIVPRSKANPAAVQRFTIASKIESIEKKVKGSDFQMPGSIVINVKDNDLMKIGEHGSSNQAPMKKITFNFFELYMELVNLESRLEDKTIDLIEVANEVDSILNNFRNKESWIGDGQHRVLGVMSAGYYSKSLVAVVYDNAPKETIYRVFNDVNAYQDKPNKEQVAQIKKDAGRLSDKEKTIYAIVEKLEKECPALKNKIKIYSKQDNETWINASKLQVLITKHIWHRIGHLDDPYKIISDYLQAWKDCFQHAWGFNNIKSELNKNREIKISCVLTKAMGFEIMARLFVVIFDDGCTNKDIFVSKMKNLMFNNGSPESISIEGAEDSHELDFSSKKFGSYSSGKGIGAITDAIVDKIYEKKKIK